MAQTITLSSLITRIRRLVNDQDEDLPDGQPRPSLRFRDDEIVHEIQRALLELLEKEPFRFYPSVFGAPERIAALDHAQKDTQHLPVQDSSCNVIEFRVNQVLDSTNQEGIRPEAAAQVIQTIIPRT